MRRDLLSRRVYVQPLTQLSLPMERHTQAPQISSVVAEFLPAQQMALLILRKSDLGNAVLARLRRSTVRAGARDYYDLERQCLAERKADGFHKLTPHGHFKANAVARELAQQFGIKIEVPKTRPRGMYETGIKATFNFW